MNKPLNKTATIQNIMNKANSSIGVSINVEKFNQKSDDEAFLIEAAEFLKAEVVYK